MRRNDAELNNLVFRAFQYASDLRRFDIAEHLVCAMERLVETAGDERCRSQCRKRLERAYLRIVRE